MPEPNKENAALSPDQPINYPIDNLTLRRAGRSDATTIVHFLRKMITDMESMGGHVTSPSDASWAQLERDAPSRLQSADKIYLIAETGSEAIGFGEAKCTSAHPVFASRQILHISSLYVTPEHRRKGVGKAILKELLDWGHNQGCSGVELNVLVGNPARNLYRDLGFSEFEVKMVRDL